MNLTKINMIPIVVAIVLSVSIAFALVPIDTNIPTTLPANMEILSEVPVADSVLEIKPLAVSDTTNIDVDISNIPQLEREEFFREKFNISSDVEIKPAVAATIVKLNVTDNEKLQEVVQISQSVQEEKRDKIAVELAGMNRVFVKKFAHKIQVDTKFEQRVENYINYVEGRHEIKLKIEKTKLDALFNKKIDTKTFIDQITEE